MSNSAFSEFGEQSQSVPDDDPRAHLRELPQLNSFGVRTVGTNLLTVRVDLDG